MAESTSWAETLRRPGLRPAGGNFRSLQKFARCRSIAASGTAPTLVSLRARPASRSRSDVSSSARRSRRSSPRSRPRAGARLGAAMASPTTPCASGCGSTTASAPRPPTVRPSRVGGSRSASVRGRPGTRRRRPPGIRSRRRSRPWPRLCTRKSKRRGPVNASSASRGQAADAHHERRGLGEVNRRQQQGGQGHEQDPEARDASAPPAHRGRGNRGPSGFGPSRASLRAPSVVPVGATMAGTWPVPSSSSSPRGRAHA